MKDYINKDYALNKYSEGIVYVFADKIVTVTLEDYLVENPDKTPDDFFALKKQSDDIYRKQDQDENAQTNKNVSLYALDKNTRRCVPSPEDVLIEKIDGQEKAKKRRHCLNVSQDILGKLTEKQRRRYKLHSADGLTVREIAEMEGVSHPTIVESLTAAKKKIKKFLKNI